MGIKGLLPLLEGIQKHTHLRNFAGQTLGIDAYGWLHRGTFACATELAQGKPTRAHINFAMNRVRMLIHFGVTPYVVFDGDYLPSKSQTEKGRAERRREARRQGLSLLQAGKVQQATQELRKAVDVTPSMARDLIEELKLAGVSYVVAPFEADSQLAYLEKKGLINGIISEDSDLLVFGAARLITKLDQYGDCVMFRRQDFTQCREISLINWSDREFRMMAMLSGCDYLPGIDKLGLKTAYRLVRKYKTIEAIVRNLQFDGKLKVPAGFLEDFLQADRTFLHQWVFCPEAKRLVHLNVLTTGLTLEEMPYIGKYVEPELAQGVAAGDLDPNSKKPLKASKYIPPRRASMPAPATPDLKGKKPISEYFKPYRTPLAELDPNSFTPSPSQQRLLSTQQNRSWSASHTTASRASDPMRRTSVPAPGSALRQTPKSQLSPRRKRFCADVLADLQGDAASTVSHYFSSPAITRKVTKQSKAEFELFSDDSVTEAMHASVAAVEASITQSQTSDQLTTVQVASQAIEECTHLERPQLSRSSTSPKKRKRLEVYHDEPATQESVATESQSSIVTATSFVDSQDVVAVADPVSDFEKLAAPWKYEQPTKQEACVPHTPARKQTASIEKTLDLTTPRPGTLAALLDVKGSEDFLIPQSPASNEGDDVPKANLDRFLFGN